MGRKSPTETSTTNRSTASDSGRAPNRRSFLRATAGVAAATAGLAVAGSTTATASYQNVVNIVDDFGADNTGKESSLEELHEAVEDDTKVIFPEGEYWLGEGFYRWDFGEGREGERVSNVALVGEGDVTLRPTDGTVGFIFAVWGTGVHVENFRIDQTAANTNVGLSLRCEDDLLVRDVRIDGVSDTFRNTKLGPAVTDPDGTGLVENFHVRDGSMGYSRNTGVWMFPEHAGEILFQRCSFEGLSDNAIYASSVAHPTRGGLGAVGVENCYFKNNNVSAIRLGSPGSYAKNCTVVLDGYIPEYDSWGAVTARAAWLWSEFEGELKNIHVVNNHSNGYGFLDYPGHEGTIDVRNCRFEMNADGNQAVNFTNGSGEIGLENVSITGEAGDGTAIDLANRDTSIRNLCLQQPGDGRNGITLDNANTSISESFLEVGGDVIVADADSDVTVRNRRKAGGCPSAQARHPLE